MSQVIMKIIPWKHGIAGRVSTLLAVAICKAIQKSLLAGRTYQFVVDNHLLGAYSGMFCIYTKRSENSFCNTFHSTTSHLWNSSHLGSNEFSDSNKLCKSGNPQIS